MTVIPLAAEVGFFHDPVYLWFTLLGAVVAGAAGSVSVYKILTLVLGRHEAQELKWHVETRSSVNSAVETAKRFPAAVAAQYETLLREVKALRDDVSALRVRLEELKKEKPPWSSGTIGTK